MDKPIIFRPDMVRAIIAGTKTKTRRLLVPQFDEIIQYGWDRNKGALVTGKINGEVVTAKLPWWAGDQLWVRECHRDDPGIKTPNAPKGVAYKADWKDAAVKWRPSIHMYRRKSRITLIVRDFEIERLQDIDEGDAAAEGIVRINRHIVMHGRMDGYGIAGTDPADAHTTRVSAYMNLWQDINRKKAPWQTNPYVTVTTFEARFSNVDKMKKAA